MVRSVSRSMWSAAARRVGVGLLLLASSRGVRALVLLVFAGVLAWQVYRTVWEPIQAPVPLPEGVLADDLSISIDVLRTIDAQRASRTGAKPLFFEQARGVLVAPAPSPPLVAL